MRSFLMLTSLLWLCWSAAACGQEDVISILEKWRQRNLRIRRVQYDLLGKVAALRGAMTNDLQSEGGKPTAPVPPQDYVVDAPGRVLLDLDGSRARVDRRRVGLNWDLGVCEPSQDSSLFDGRVRQTYYPSAENAKLGAHLSDGMAEIFIEKDLPGFFQDSELPILLAHGILPHSGALIPTPADLKAPELPADWKLVATNVAIRGRSHILLHTGPLFPNRDDHYEFWVDPAQDCAVSKLQFVSGGTASFAIDTDFQQVEGNWLPAKWKLVSFSKGEEITCWREVTVARCDLRPRFDANAFHIIPPTGMIVQDNVTVRSFVTPRPGESEVPVTHALLKERRTFVWWMRAVFASVAILAAVVGYLLYRLATSSRLVRT